MKALVLKEYNRLVYQDVPIPDIGPDDVLVDVKACGICGSDVHGMDGSTGRRHPPLIMGHEAAGVIVETGGEVRGWTKGDRVTFDSTIYCGRCQSCRSGAINLCDNRRVLGVACDEFSQSGAFAEYVAVPQRILYAVPEGVPFEHAAMVEPLSIAVHAVARTPVRLGDTAAVVGSGIIGLLIVQVLRAAGAGDIIAVDIEDGRLQTARNLGADVCLNPNTCDVVGETGGGVDISFEAVGTSPAVRTAVNCLKKGGAVSLVGNVSPKVELPLQTVVSREITIHGSCASRGEYPTCLNMMAAGNIDVGTLISTVAPLAEGADWFRRLYNKEQEFTVIP